MAHFEKREFDQNTWFPEVAGVGFSERLARYMGQVASDGTELYTAWFVDGDHEEQVTPDVAKVFVSLTDDDSDVIMIYDRRDDMHFQFFRSSMPDAFPHVFQLIAPWSVVAHSLTPLPEVYQRFIDMTTKDTETDELFVPDDWTTPTED